ncbi:MAG: FkbM family methyltransferase [Burkholderiales bacterium]
MGIKHQAAQEAQSFRSDDEALSWYEGMEPHIEIPLPPECRARSIFGRPLIRFWTPNRTCLWRAQTLYTKEPDTVNWIKGFPESSVFCDVGANVGMYTIFAAALGHRVMAFECESWNYSLLNRNVALNGFGQSVSAFPVALSDVVGYSEMFLAEMAGGSSCHQVGRQLDFGDNPLHSAFRQGVYCDTLDSVFRDEQIARPQFIKIDVDGIEDRILTGGARLLVSPGTKGVLVELNTNLERHRKIPEVMREWGFYWDEAQVEAAKRRDGPFRGVGNWIFSRDCSDP